MSTKRAHREQASVRNGEKAADLLTFATASFGLLLCVFPCFRFRFRFSFRGVRPRRYAHAFVYALKFFSITEATVLFCASGLEAGILYTDKFSFLIYSSLLL